MYFDQVCNPSTVIEIKKINNDIVIFKRSNLINCSKHFVVSCFLFCLGIIKKMNQNLNDLIEQSKTLLKVIDDVHKLLDDAQDDLNKNILDDEYLMCLTKAVNQTCVLANTYLKNFNAFMEEQLNLNEQNSI